MSDDLTQNSRDFASLPATIRLGDLEVTRLGYGAMRLPGKDVWGEPDDPARARAVLRRALELGINFIDTAWFYGPHVANRLIAEALHPYPKDLVIATKLGGRRTPDKGWVAFARPEELRQGCEEDLRTLRLERCDVTHFRYMPGAGVPFRESLDAMIELQKEGKIRHLALSNVGTAELFDALARTPIVAVQNLYNMTGGLGALAHATHAAVESPDAVLAACEARGIAYLPFFPLATGDLGKAHPALDGVAARHGATPAQLALAWLLARSPVMLPIPGTGSLAHLEENWAARTIALTQDEVEALAREARALA
ncbi:aldo/keto reductase [Nannocystis punicea]|uniref:Aldo/keto reductase n=1 Tax=Nannocystis punicea TaxID=2995304 RepID=A0ABY7H8Z9_9BACT|nr:aldo/keto reductase [Nannocystis poenicansa]WAS95751.1 aldo/keto reductase [Nannocystis poenicansa]